MALNHFHNLHRSSVSTVERCTDINSSTCFASISVRFPSNPSVVLVHALGIRGGPDGERRIEEVLVVIGNNQLGDCNRNSAS